jgi:hypothetical protein
MSDTELDTVTAGRLVYVEVTNQGAGKPCGAGLTPSTCTADTRNVVTQLTFGSGRVCQGPSC